MGWEERRVRRAAPTNLTSLEVNALCTRASAPNCVSPSLPPTPPPCPSPGFPSRPDSAQPLLLRTPGTSPREPSSLGGMGREAWRPAGGRARARGTMSCTAHSRPAPRAPHLPRPRGQPKQPRVGARGVLPPPAGAGNVRRSGGVASGRSRAGPVHSWLHFRSTFRNPPARVGVRHGQPRLPDQRVRSAAGAGRSCGRGGGDPRGCRKRPPGTEPTARRASRAGTWLWAPAFSGPPASRVAPRGAGMAAASRRQGGKAADQGPGCESGLSAGAGPAAPPGPRLRARQREGWGARGGGWSASRRGAAALPFRAGCAATAGRAPQSRRPPGRAKFPPSTCNRHLRGLRGALRAGGPRRTHAAAPATLRPRQVRKLGSPPPGRGAS